MATTSLTESSVFNSLIVYNNAYDNTLVSADCSLLDSLVIPNLFDSFLKYENELKFNYSTRSLDSSYDFRPDKIAVEMYGNQLYYPAILICNNLCSLIQFRPKNLNYEVKVPTPEILQYVINKLNQ
jgi:hypothetical protein